jgi:low affinity Fe/Cu permease
MKSPGSRVLHAIDRLTARPVVAWTLVTADVAWILLSIVLGFPDQLEVAFETLAAALTVALVFVIQHTQSREQLVTQRKLDEILAALPQANRALVGLEDAGDDELAEIHSTHRNLRANAVDD